MTQPDQTDDPGSLLAILDQLSELVTAARAMPMSASALVNRAEVLDLLASAREAVPGQITQADRLVADADALVDDARSRAAHILAEARGEAERLVSHEQVVTDAGVRAAELVAEARLAADELARDADDYCDRQLARFEIDLGQIGGQVAAGRARLAERGLPEEGHL